ncbi:MAG: hypothetical protein LH470_04230 [Lysobacter sp.]|nr:hypothetical protein [Lysobacter sp.]
MLNKSALRFAPLLLLLLATTSAGWAAARSTAKFPTLGGEPGNDLTCESIPDAPQGHFVCEDKESYERCKALEGKGKVRVNGAKKGIPVVACRQGG